MVLVYSTFGIGRGGEDVIHCNDSKFYFINRAFQDALLIVE